jgi:hypothetical protein
MAFLRTPKFKEKESFKQAMQSTRAETPLAILLTAGAGVSAATQSGIDAVFLTTLCAWSSLLFWSAPVTAFIAARMELRSTALAERRQLDSLRARIPLYRRPPSYAWATVAACALLAIMAPSVALGPGGSVIADALTPKHLDQTDAGGSEDDGPGNRTRRGDDRNFAQLALGGAPARGLERARKKVGSTPGSLPRERPNYRTGPVSQPQTSPTSQPSSPPSQSPSSPPSQPPSSPPSQPQTGSAPGSQPSGTTDHPTTSVPQPPTSPSTDHPTGPSTAHLTGPPDGTPQHSPR